jgi:rRNA-processing protein FCF1
MDVAVNDTNILIDLYNIGLLEVFFNSGLNLHTTDFVLEEITNVEQSTLIKSLIARKKLYVKEFSVEELLEISVFKNKQSSNVSITDCSVWKYAEKNNFVLLTGDGTLRRDAQRSGVKVRGILFVFDFLVEHQIITRQCALDKLKELMKGNVRLPKTECERRISLWAGQL